MNFMIYLINIICFFGCSLHPLIQEKKAPTNDSMNSRYKVKSAILYYKSSNSIPPANKLITLNFDEYGKKESIRIETDIADIKQYQVIIKLDDLQYMMLDTLQCIKANRKKKFSLDNLDVSVLNDYDKTEYGITIAQNEEFFLGKKCDKYIINNKEKKIKGELLIWQNIPLRIILNKNGLREITEAYKIEANAKVLPQVFDVPKNIEILDMTSIDNN